MKQLSLLILVLFLFGIVRNLPAEDESSTNHTIAADIEITDTAINRFLQEQYNEANFPRVISGSIQNPLPPYQTINYTLTLDLPSIMLLDNAAKVRLVIDVTSDVGSYHLAIEPTLDIPPGNISTSRVTAILTDLPNVVQALPIDQWLKNALFAAYNSLELVMYPSKLIEEISDFDWLNQRRILVTDLALSWSVEPDLLKLAVSTTVNSALPTFHASLSEYYHDMGVLSNIEVTVVSAVIAEFGSGDIIWESDPNVICPKNGSIYIPTGNLELSPTFYFIWVHFTIDDTFYIRKFKVFPGSGWHGAANSIN